MSLDNGASYVPIKAFSPPGGNVIIEPACGGCRFRVYVTNADSTHTVTVGVTVSGAIVPATAP